jgi:aspartyl-tRNA(Asn)/glutamyl-tRNA(Gln) amidotransferase subunit A
MSAEPFTVAELARALASRAVTAEEVTQRCLAAIEERNGSLNAFITVAAKSALDQARRADGEMAGGRHRGPLHGVPVSVKDIIDVAGLPTTAASRVRQGHVAARDATIVRRLEAGGAVIVGKTNLHEFALGTTNEDSAFGPARHPLDPSRSPGGSSGGSAVSVAASMAYASIGTDTGGSVRIPAAACGLVGLKPSMGELPLDGVVPLSTTLDHVGPICRSVVDAYLLYRVLSGEASPPPLQIVSARGLRVGFLRPYFTELLDDGVEAAFDEACSRARDAGVQILDTAIPRAADAEMLYPHIAVAEAATYHFETLRRQPEDYTPNVRLRLDMGTYILAEDYVRALRGRDVLQAEVDTALTRCDALLLPSLAVPAPLLGAQTIRVKALDVPVRAVMLRLTQLFNITGHPAITLPCGTTPDGFPVGAQLVGRRGETPALLELAGALEPHLGPGASR